MTQDNTATNNKRIARNTILLYIRMILLMFVNLYTSRIVLQTLGVSDFGVYNVIGGLVAMFSIVSSSLTTAISRFITVALGKRDKQRLSEVFSTSVLVQILLALTVIGLAESLGVWFLNSKMNIPLDRMSAANWVFQFSVFSFATNLISIPYNACIVAHEKMNAFAYISILEASLKLLIVYLLVLSPLDKLITYSLLLLIVAFIIRGIYSIYCKKKFSECHFEFIWNVPLIKEMVSFAGWSFIGNTAGILRNQGGNILLNIYGGPIINAAAGIANQVNTAVVGFSNNFIMAVNPQIMKLYSQGNVDKAYHLAMHGSRLSFMLMLLITTPLIVLTPHILHLWLSVIPEFSVTFVRLILFLSLIECLCIPLVTLNQATGKIRNYQLVVGTIHLLNFPISWLALYMGYPPKVVYIISIFLAVINLYARLIMLNVSIHISVMAYTKMVTYRVLLCSGCCFFPIYIIIKFSLNEYLLLFFVMMITMFVVFTMGLRQQERSFIRKKISR